MMAWIAEPRPFDRSNPNLRRVFNGWKFSGVVTAGSGRPINARVIGDSNRDGNPENDRLPGSRRNAFTGPDYYTTDLRLARQFYFTERWRLEALFESFNVANRVNRRIRTTDDGFAASAARFVGVDKVISSQRFPAHFRRQKNFRVPSDAYAPRQLQVGLRLRW